MRVVLLRVGIDSGCGGIQGPLFQDRTFEYIPIPNDDNVVGKRTYEDTRGVHGKPLIEYFPESLQSKRKNQFIHADPEFETYTYGDPSRLKSSLKRLDKGDMLIFYCGLQGWDFECKPALYLLGYFEVLKAGIASDFDSKDIDDLFSRNVHVMDRDQFKKENDRLVLVKGSDESRLFKKAHLISAMGEDKIKRPIKVLSSDMIKYFGNFNGKLCIQRSPPRWIDPTFVDEAVKFTRSRE
jgi:hypothetical protein